MEQWEKSKGIKSFGKYCDELYLNSDFESFNSLGEIKAYIEKNKKYLQLIEDENGDLRVETILYNNPKRYLINHDMMYQVGDTIFKVFPQGIAVESSKNISKLKKLTNEAFLSSNYHKQKNLSKSEIISNLKNTNSDCGTYNDGRSTNGNNRTYLVSIRKLMKICSG